MLLANEGFSADIFDLMLLTKIIFYFVLLVNLKKIVLLTNEHFLIKCCCRMTKTKLIREWCDKKPSQIPLKMTIGPDFEQFCAAREFTFFGPIKCCSRVDTEKKMLSEKKKKSKGCSGIKDSEKIGFSTNFSSKCCCWMTRMNQLAVEWDFRKKQVFETFFLTII